jgi:hypothetical protein
MTMPKTLLFTNDSSQATICFSHLHSMVAGAFLEPKDDGVFSSPFVFIQ